MNTLSMFAATTCSAVSSPAAWRVKWVRRGRIARSTASDCVVLGSTAAQSPTAGVRSRLGTSARTVPSPARVVHAPRSTRETRAGMAPAACVLVERLAPPGVPAEQFEA